MRGRLSGLVNAGWYPCGMSNLIIRRRLLAALAGAAAVGTLSGTAGAQSRVPQYERLDLLYLGTDDCPYCRRWESRTKDAFLASPEGRAVNFVHVKGRTLREPIVEQHYPPEFRWVFDKIGPSRGVPRFLLVMDGKLVMSAFGLNEWEDRFRPALKDLVQGQRPR